MLTKCCGAPFYKPGYPDIDICTNCKEHASPLEEEGFEDDDTWEESEEYLNYKERRPEK